MTVHTRERKRIWCRLFGHATFVYADWPHSGLKIICLRCGEEKRA